MLPYLFHDFRGLESGCAYGQHIVKVETLGSILERSLCDFGYQLLTER